jgi:hypothetical protein
MNICVSHDIRGVAAVSSFRSAVSWRKILILQRGALAEAWCTMFPKHDFGTARLYRYSTDAFEAACDRAQAKAAGRHAATLKRLRCLLKEDVSLDRTLSDINRQGNRPTPQVTIEAIWLCVRERGIVALKEPPNLERLSRCDKAALAQIDARLARLKEGGR